MNTYRQKLIWLLFSAVLLLTFAAPAQSSKEKLSDDKPVKKETDISKTYAFDGTYQLEIINTRYMPLLPANLMETIRTNRDESEIKTVVINKLLRVKILPWKVIKSGSFTPFKEKYIHVSE